VFVVHTGNLPLFCVYALSMPSVVIIHSLSQHGEIVTPHRSCRIRFIFTTFWSITAFAATP
jgi:hypothetical protein